MIPAADEVLAAQSRKFAAQVAGDAAALGELLADELVYTHANGMVDDKASLIRSLSEKSYLAVECLSSDVLFCGDVAVVTGEVDITVHEALRFKGRYTDVWVRRDGWKNLAWQSTIVPPVA